MCVTLRTGQYGLGSRAQNKLTHGYKQDFHSIYTSLFVLVKPPFCLLSRRCPPSCGLHRNHDQCQDGSGLPHALDGSCISVDGNVPLPWRQHIAVPHEIGRAKQPVDELPAGRAEVGSAVEGQEAVDEAVAQDAVEDAAAEGGAEAAAEAAEGGEQAGGDVFGAGVAQVEDVDEGVVEGDAGGDAVEADDGDEDEGRGGWVGDDGQGGDCEEGEGEGEQLGGVVGAGAADV